MKREAENEEFRKYREQMHGSENSESRPVMGSQNKVMRGVFAIIMIIIYVGVGFLLIANPFGWKVGMWSESILAMRWIVGICLILYGGFRAFRYIKGIN